MIDHRSIHSDQGMATLHHLHTSHPERGGPHPGHYLLHMDRAGDPRGNCANMARRLAYLRLLRDDCPICIPVAMVVMELGRCTSDPE